VANNNNLVLGAIGCLVLTGFAGLSCAGFAGVGWYLYSRPAAPDLAAMPDVEAPSAVAAPPTHADLLSDAGFLDLGAGVFAGPSGTVAEPAPTEPAAPAEPPPVARRRGATEPKPEAAEAPAPPPAEDEAPVISDEDVKALDLEVQQIEAANEAAATETKKKKKNR
jgi:hypothetical protein